MTTPMRRLQAPRVWLRYVGRYWLPPLLWLRAATAHPRLPLAIAVVDEHPAEVYGIAQVLHAQGVPYVLQMLESSQRARHFFDRLATQDAGKGPDLLLLDFSFPGLDTRALLQWITALPEGRRGRIVVMIGADDPAVEEQARAQGR